MEYSSGDVPPPPILRAVASSTRPLYQLLKSIGFASKVHVEITENGLRFAADHARVMQGKLGSSLRGGGFISMVC